MTFCTMIMGTNGVGKSTLARTIQQRLGGIQTYANEISYLSDGESFFLGKYAGVKLGGVDYINEAKKLAQIARKGLKTHKNCFMEGRYINTISQYLLNVLFSFDRQLVVLLYLPEDKIRERIIQRTGVFKGDMPYILKAQKNAMNAMVKYKAMGVPILCINTSEISPDDIADKILTYIKNN